MTSETPCPPGCREWPTYPSNGIGWANSDGVSVTHAPNCPIAKPAEPPAPTAQEEFESLLEHSALMPEPQREERCEGALGCMRTEKGQHIDGCLFGDAKPQSEPPFPPRPSTAKPWTVEQVLVAHEALKAERDALRAENAAKYEEIASERHCYTLLEAERQRLYDANAALKARVEDITARAEREYAQEGHGMFFADEILAIINRKQEASNG